MFITGRGREDRAWRRNLDGKISAVAAYSGVGRQCALFFQKRNGMLEQIRNVPYLPTQPRESICGRPRNPQEPSRRRFDSKDSKVRLNRADMCALGGRLHFFEVRSCPPTRLSLPRVNGKAWESSNRRWCCRSVGCRRFGQIGRFIRFCDSFNIPLLTLVDIPGYLPGPTRTCRGDPPRRKVLYAYSEATVPKITVILRKHTAAAYIAMCSNHLGADFVFAWPTAEIASWVRKGRPYYIRNEIMGPAPGEMRKLKVKEYSDNLRTIRCASSGYVMRHRARGNTRIHRPCLESNRNKENRARRESTDSAVLEERHCDEQKKFSQISLENGVFETRLTEVCLRKLYEKQIRFIKAVIPVLSRISAGPGKAVKQATHSDSRGNEKCSTG